MQEVWKDVEGYVGFYQVSNFGRVKSCARKISAGEGSNHKYNTLTERLLSLNSSGKYCQVIMCKNGIAKAKTVHRLVAEAFIPNPNNLPCVNHKDENPLNNCVDNLEWCTYKYNNEYNNRVGKCKDKISKTLAGRKVNRLLTDKQRKNISNGAKRGWETRRKNIKSAITEQVAL
ncbi:NUMOD4 motif-containing HNH endonuclease [bacterium]|nr:NUMOD4 motif-containing HNH endonuclease [bacterium]